MVENLNQVFYQIRLFCKGRIEIFQNVFYHKIYNNPYSVIIHYSSTKNYGSFTNSTRPLGDVYNFEVIEDPEFSPKGPNPRDKVIIMHGSGKTVKYDPVKDMWE